MFQTFAPSAIRPPSANSRHWMSSTPIIVKNAAYGPTMAVSSIPPQRWPDDPVPGIVKFIICAAKTNAPMTPMVGMILSVVSRFCSSLCTLCPAATAEAAYITPATPGESNASAMCIIQFSISFVSSSFKIVRQASW